ncbi:MAG: CapA family protein [Lachnospiraceae bacterium]
MNVSKGLSLMKKQQSYFCFLMGALMLLLCFSLCGKTYAVSDLPAVSGTAEEYDITLMAVGDNLLHMGIVNTGIQSDGTRNYDFLFDGIRSFLDQADIKIINQETILGGNQLGFHGYPKFNSPSEVSDAISKASFNVVLQATNHTADQGLSGIQNCLDLWKTHPEVLITGLHEPFPADFPSQNRIPLLEINGCTFAFLNYTYGPNDSSVSSSLSEQLDMLCAVDETSRMIDFTTLNPQVLTDITAADMLADIVVVCPHWGTEYSTVPSSYQETFAMQMAEAGADLIIGTHPHVVQPVVWIDADNGNRALCYYSLGNYVSTQQNAQSMLEGLAWVTFHVTEDGVRISEESTGIIPLVCHYSSGPVRLRNVYLLENYTEALAQSHGIIPYGGVAFHLSSLQRWSDEILGGWVRSASEISQQYHARPE